MKSDAVFYLPGYIEKAETACAARTDSRNNLATFVALLYQFQTQMIALPSIFFPASNWMNLDFKILRVHCKHGNWLSSEFETEANSVVWTEGSYEIEAKKEGKKIMLLLVGFFYCGGVNFKQLLIFRVKASWRSERT